MKIDSLKINHFGKLKEKEIQLKPKINIIYGENETGKSTLLKFITGMFFGVSKNKNGKWISDLERYTPWETGEFSGKIQYHLENGKSYEVFREFKKKNPKIYDENSVDISKNFSIDKTKGNHFFVEQTGVDEELFCSTIVSEQTGVKLEEKDRQSIIQKVANLMGTGQDQTSFEKVMAKLNKRQLEEIGTEKSQERPINMTKRKIEELGQKTQELEKYHETQYEIQERKESLQEQIQEKENKWKALKEIKQLQDEQMLEEEKVKVKQEDLKEYQEKIQQIEKRKEDIVKQKVILPKPSYLLPILGSILAVVILLVSLLLKNWIVTGIGSVILLASIGYFCFIKVKYKKQHQQINEEKDKDIEILNQQIEMIQENETEKQEIVNTLKEQVRKKLEQENSRVKNKYIHKVENIEELLQKENIAYECEYLQNQINSKKLELQSLEIEEKQVLPELDKLASMKEELEKELERYDDLQEYTECIQLAKQTLEEAYFQMKQEVTPKFTQNLSENMKRISKGKYQKVSLNEQNEIMVQLPNGSYVSAESLSIGTIDQIYLSLRLAIAEDIGKEKMPIILDEAFAYFDEERLANVLEFFYENFQDRQILIFTCTKREQKILEEKGMEYHKIQMEKD